MRYHDIAKDNLLNGDGIRAVLFVSGCTHHCPQCHNPVTWNKNSGLHFDEAAKKELFDYLSKDYVAGVTFSGGDPLAMYNREEVLELIKEVKEKFPDKTVWVYSGWTKDELKSQGFWDKLESHIDVFVEGKFEIDKKSTSYNWAGSTNQRVLRKESGFEINTSDPVYIKFQDLKKSLDLMFLSKTPEGLLQTLDDICKSTQVGDVETNCKKILEDIQNIPEILKDYGLSAKNVGQCKKAVSDIANQFESSREQITFGKEVEEIDQ